MKRIALAMLALTATPALAQQGVSSSEIVLGTAQDLSGPIVSLSKPAVNGMRMKIDEVNAAGGINGRKLRLVVEDHGYDPKKAVLAAQKMVQQDKIFAALGSIGTPTAVAAMPIYLDRNVAHLFPLTGAREMFEPLHKLKYSFSAPYYDQIRAAMKRVIWWPRVARRRSRGVFSATIEPSIVAILPMALLAPVRVIWMSAFPRTRSVPL